MKKVLFTTAIMFAYTTGMAFAEDTPTITTAPFEEIVEAQDIQSNEEEQSSGRINIALGAKISTLGVGPELAVGFNDYLTARISGGWAEFSVDGDTDEVDWDTDLKMANGLGTVEWNVFGGEFHIDVGFLVHDNHVEASAQGASGQTITYNGTVYTSEEAGKVSGDIEFENSVAPYVGIGWGNPVSDDDTWTIFFNLGVVFQGSPDVSLSSTGTLAGNPAFEADLLREEQELEDELDKFEYYPVVTLGVAYRF